MIANVSLLWATPSTVLKLMTMLSAGGIMAILFTIHLLGVILKEAHELEELLRVNRKMMTQK